MPKKARGRSATRSRTSSNKRWVASVKTVSTFPPEGLFTKDAATIARVLASKKVSPKGPGSGMRMLTYFINRGGRGLSASRRAELERAKRLLSERIRNEKQKTSSRAAGRKPAGVCDELATFRILLCG
jgi:hypothetical protein